MDSRLPFSFCFHFLPGACARATVDPTVRVSVFLGKGSRVGRAAGPGKAEESVQ